MGVLLNAYATIRSIPDPDFPHVLRGRRDRTDPALAQQAEGIVGYIRELLQQTGNESVAGIRREMRNTLEEGAGKLNLADITEEGANLVALQTRQQLGISALAFAGQSEQAVLQLFR